MSSEAHRRAVRKYYERHRDRGLCGWCSEMAVFGTRCEKHLNIQREGARRRDARKRRERVAAGWCVVLHCDLTRNKHPKYCDEHFEKLENAVSARRA